MAEEKDQVNSKNNQDIADKVGDKVGEVTLSPLQKIAKDVNNGFSSFGKKGAEQSMEDKKTNALRIKDRKASLKTLSGLYQNSNAAKAARKLASKGADTVKSHWGKLLALGLFLIPAKTWESIAETSLQLWKYLKDLPWKKIFSDLGNAIVSIVETLTPILQWFAKKLFGEKAKEDDFKKQEGVVSEKQAALDDNTKKGAGTFWEESDADFTRRKGKEAAALQEEITKLNSLGSRDAKGNFEGKRQGGLFGENKTWLGIAAGLGALALILAPGSTLFLGFKLFKGIGKGAWKGFKAWKAARAAKALASKKLAKEAAELATKKVVQETAELATKKAAQQTAESVGKKVAKEAVTKVAEKSATKALVKTGAKAGAKGLGKSLLKKIPGVGLLAGLAFGASRAFAGDFSGAAMEIASGAASLAPGAGTAASVAIDAALIAKDIAKAKKKAEEGTKESDKISETAVAKDGKGTVETVKETTEPTAKKPKGKKFSYSKTWNSPTHGQGMSDSLDMMVAPKDIGAFEGIFNEWRDTVEMKRKLDLSGHHSSALWNQLHEKSYVLVQKMRSLEMRDSKGGSKKAKVKEPKAIKSEKKSGGFFSGIKSFFGGGDSEEPKAVKSESSTSSPDTTRSAAASSDGTTTTTTRKKGATRMGQHKSIEVETKSGPSSKRMLEKSAAHHLEKFRSVKSSNRRYGKKNMEGLLKGGQGGFGGHKKAHRAAAEIWELMNEKERKKFAKYKPAMSADDTATRTPSPVATADKVSVTPSVATPVRDASKSLDKSKRQVLDGTRKFGGLLDDLGDQRKKKGAERKLAIILDRNDERSKKLWGMMNDKQKNKVGILHKPKSLRDPQDKTDSMKGLMDESFNGKQKQNGSNVNVGGSTNNKTINNNTQSTVLAQRPSAKDPFWDENF